MIRKALTLALLALVSACGGGDGGAPVSGGTLQQPVEGQTPQQPIAGEKPQPPVAAETSLQFIARTSAGTGTRDLTTTPERVNFSGCLRKFRTSDPRTMGAAAFLTNLTTTEYRLTAFSYVLDTSGLLPGETVETDVGFTVLPKAEVVALNSGEELLITHRYDTETLDRGVVNLALPAGGVSLKPDQRLSIGSVSAIFPLSGAGAQVISDARLADGTFMRVCYSADLVRADQAPGKRVASYRSPYRDRSYVSDPARTTAPFTDFKNTSTAPVKVYGIGAFLSNLSDSELSDHAIDVFVNGVRSTQITLPSHVPGTTTPLYPMISDVAVTLNPGDVLSVRGKVTPRKAIVFDFAAFIFADEGLTPVVEQLDMLNADLDGDGYNDILDIDALGSVWVSLRVGAGLQNTQQEWARDVKGVENLDVLPRARSADPLIVQATNSRGLCLNMRAIPASMRFILDYCQNGGAPSVANDIWGDFNGDGWPDRMRISTSLPGYLVALGGPAGLGAEQPWVVGYGAVEKMFASDANGDGRTDLMAEWSDITGPRCVIWLSTGSAFNQTPCSR